MRQNTQLELLSLSRDSAVSLETFVSLVTVVRKIKKMADHANGINQLIVHIRTGHVQNSESGVSEALKTGSRPSAGLTGNPA